MNENLHELLKCLSVKCPFSHNNECGIPVNGFCQRCSGRTLKDKLPDCEMEMNLLIDCLNYSKCIDKIPDLDHETCNGHCRCYISSKGMAEVHKNWVLRNLEIQNRLSELFEKHPELKRKMLDEWHEESKRYYAGKDR